MAALRQVSASPGERRNALQSCTSGGLLRRALSSLLPAFPSVQCLFSDHVPIVRLLILRHDATRLLQRTHPLTAACSAATAAPLPQQRDHRGP